MADEGTTNNDRPFEPGEIIEYADEKFVVRANYGQSGIVEAWPLNGEGHWQFCWNFEGEDCIRTGERVNG